MAAVRKRGKFWTAIWRDSEGKQCWRSTKETDKRKAEERADTFERESRLSPDQLTTHRFQKVLAEVYESKTKVQMGKATVRSFCAQWLSFRQSELSGASHDSYTGAVSALIASLESKGRADIDLFQLNKEDIVRFRDARRGQISASTINLQLKIVRIMLETAKDDGAISDNPSNGVKRLKEDEESQGALPFSTEQMKAVLANCDHEWESMVVHGYYTGQRLGDIARMQARCIDIGRRRVIIQTGKTGATVIVEMPPAYESWLKARGIPADPAAFLHPESAKTVEKSKTVGTLSNRFAVILWNAGLRTKPTHAKKKDGRGRSGARSRERVSFHSLRHTLVSELARAGVSRSLVQDMVGHESAQVNASYTHFDSDTKREALAKLPSILPG